MQEASLETTLCLIPATRHSGQGENIDSKKFSGCPGLEVGVGEMGVTANEYRVSFWSDKNVLVDCGDGCTTLNIQKKPLLYILN